MNPVAPVSRMFAKVDGKNTTPARRTQSKVQAVAGQPKLNDGRTVVDCEGFAALNEQVLGKIKDKSGKPMFELQQVQNNSHIMTAVFRRGDPGNEPFMVNNDQIQPISQENVAKAKGLSGGNMNTPSMREWLDDLNRTGD